MSLKRITEMKIYNLYKRDIEVYVAIREQRFSNETKN